MKKINGFTLVEMLVCVAIIAVIGVAIGLSSGLSSTNAKKNEYQNIMREVFTAATICVEMSSCKPITCNTSTDCTIDIGTLVNAGLLDKNIYNTDIPLYKDSKKFGSIEIIKVSKTSGVKDALYTCGSTTLKLSDLDNKDFMKSFKWGTC